MGVVGVAGGAAAGLEGKPELSWVVAVGLHYRQHQGKERDEL